MERGDSPKKQEKHARRQQEDLRNGAMSWLSSQ